MTKKEKPEEVVEVPAGGVQEPGVEQHNETQEPAQGGEQAPAAPAAPAARPAKKDANLNNGVKMVHLHTTEEIDCWIGGVHYCYREGKDIQVPSDVACIFRNAGKVYRI